MLNFAAVDRLELLQGYLRQRARVVSSVAVEIRKSQYKVANLHKVKLSDWFGDEIEIDKKYRDEIEAIRRHSFGGLEKKPTQHLGESETIYLIRNFPEYKQSIFLTDDADAYEFAQTSGIAAYSTCEVLRSICAEMEITPEEAFGLVQSMWEQDRNPLNRPDAAGWFCG